MGTLRGGTTIAGFPAIHSGMQEAIFLGNVTIKGYLTLGKASSIRSEYNNAEVINDHANGNISMSAVGGDLYMGYRNTGMIRLSSNLSSSGGTTVIDTGGKLYYQGNNTDTRYLRKDNDSYLYLDTSGSTAYGRITMGNNPSTSNTYIRVSGTSGGILPYSNGNSSIGTTAWRFKEMHAVDFYEDGTKLSSKYAGSSHSHSNYVTKNGDRMSGALEIEGTSNDASRLTIFNTGTNPRNGGSLELLETGPKFGATNSNGFRIRYDGVGNELTVDSSYTSETRHMTIKRNGDMTIHTSANFDSNITAKGNISNGYATLMSSSIRFGASDEGYMGTNTGGWVFYGNRSSATYARFHDNKTIELNGDTEITGNAPWFSVHSPYQHATTSYQDAGISIGEGGKKAATALHLTYTGNGRGHIGMGVVGSSNIPANKAMEFSYTSQNVDFMAGIDVKSNVIAGNNVIAGGDVRGVLTHDRSYGYIYPFSASSYGADNSYLRYYYAGSGSATNTSNRNELRVHTMGSNAVNTRLVIDNETVPRISYGTGNPPSTSNFRNGDLHIKY